MTEDPDIRRKLAKEGRLWLLSFACAIPGALAVYIRHSVVAGVAVFLVCLVIFGSGLAAYERRIAQKPHKKTPKK